MFAGWELQSLHDLGHASWVGPVLYRSCTTSPEGRIFYLYHDLPNVLNTSAAVKYVKNDTLIFAIGHYHVALLLDFKLPSGMTSL